MRRFWNSLWMKTLNLYESKVWKNIGRKIYKTEMYLHISGIIEFLEKGIYNLALPDILTERLSSGVKAPILHKRYMCLNVNMCRMQEYLMFGNYL